MRFKAVFRHLFILVALATTPALADPVQDILDAAHAGDDNRVEALLAEAKDRMAQWELFIALSFSEPDTRAFAMDWAAAEPGNPVALTVKANALFSQGALVRGEKALVHTWGANREKTLALYSEALTLAKAALDLDPQYLPASDAVILISTRIGDPAGALAELERIMALQPNHRSLIRAAAALSPSWGGSTELTRAICDYFAGALPDMPVYDSDTCFAEAVVAGRFYVTPDEWAANHLASKADNPHFEWLLFELARKRALPAYGAEILAARLAAEGRASALIILASQPDIPTYPDMPDRDGFAAALQRDLERATWLADRDPADVEVLQRLQFVYAIEADFLGLQVLRYENPTPEEVAHYTTEMKKLTDRQERDMDLRARRLVEMLPDSSAALQFAATHLRPATTDPVAADRQAIELLEQAALLSNYQNTDTGLVALEARARLEPLTDQIAMGEVSAQDRALLDEVYVCPYVRSVRLVDAICAQKQDYEYDCILTGLKSEPSDSKSEMSLFAETAARNGCQVERQAPIEDLLYERADVPLLP